MASNVPYGLSTTTSAVEQPLGSYVRAVRRHWLLVSIVTLAVVAVAAITTLRSSSSYKTSAKILVSPIAQSELSFADTGVVQESGEPVRTVQTAAALVNSLPAAQLTAAQLGHGWTAPGVQNAVSVTPLGQSNVLDVTGQGSTPGEAAQLADTFARTAVNTRAAIVQRNISAQLAALKTRLEQITGTGLANTSLAQELSSRIAALTAAQAKGGDPTLSVSEGASIPGSPSGAPHWLIIVLALLAGFATGSVAALAVDFFTRHVRDLEEVETLLPIPVLAAVPNVQGKRGSTLQPKTFPSAAFEQLRMLRVQLAYQEAASAIMITSAGAGDGKTTLAAGLAAAFAETGEEVILMDLDLRKPDVAQLLGLQRRPASFVDAAIQDLLIDVPDLPGVRALCVPRGQPTLASMLLTRLPTLLAEAKAQASHVIVDAAPVGVASESLQIAKACDQVLLAVRPGHTDRQLLIQSRELLARAEAPVVGVVVVAYSAATTSEYDYGYSYSYSTTDPAPTSQVPSAGPAALR